MGTHLLAAETLRVADLEHWVGDISAARAEGFRCARWALAAELLGVALFATGAFLEQESFGRGQGLLLVGGGVALSGALAFLPRELSGLVSGYRSSMRRREL